jgi:hypothetical protein
MTAADTHTHVDSESKDGMPQLRANEVRGQR